MLYGKGAARLMLRSAHVQGLRLTNRNVQEGKAKKGHLGPFDKKWLMISVQDLDVQHVMASGLVPRSAHVQGLRITTLI